MKMLFSKWYIAILATVVISKLTSSIGILKAIQFLL